MCKYRQLHNYGVWNRLLRMITHKIKYKSVTSDNRKSYRYTLKAARYRQLHNYMASGTDCYE